MPRWTMVVAAAAGLLAVGALSAVAGNARGNAVSTLATGTTIKGEARGDAISALASARDQAKSHAASVDAAAEAQDSDEATSDSDTHGDAVSAVANSEATAAHQTGHKAVNHGGAVSAVAHEHDK
jgi:hypothetical protein